MRPAVCRPLLYNNVITLLYICNHPMAVKLRTLNEYTYHHVLTCRAVHDGGADVEHPALLHAHHEPDEGVGALRHAVVRPRGVVEVVHRPRRPLLFHLELPTEYL